MRRCFQMQLYQAPAQDQEPNSRGTAFPGAPDGVYRSASGTVVQRCELCKSALVTFMRHRLVGVPNKHLWKGYCCGCDHSHSFLITVHQS